MLIKQNIFAKVNKHEPYPSFFLRCTLLLYACVNIWYMEKKTWKMREIITCLHLLIPASLFVQVTREEKNNS
jgi:hypothetical protein